MRARNRLAAYAILGCMALSATPGFAYYYYTHFSSRTGPFTVIPEKFDLSTLPNKTVVFFVSDAGPVQYTPNDSFPSVLSQIRQAARAWNGVDTSDLRVAFGGLFTGALPPSNVPAAEVVFDDIPPGLLAFSGRNTSGLTSGPNGAFVPITMGIVHLSRDLTKQSGPSYQQSFYTTVVHEMGHAVGLQHTFTSSAMSTVTRATTRTNPLDSDDIAGISMLYPAASYTGTWGSISGRVTMNGQGVNLASVVALRPNGGGISTLTNPDGTYRIDGIPPDSYWVYVHPLPPSADITSPVDLANNPIPPGGAFATQFYAGASGSGTQNPTQFAPIFVTRGSTAAGINFSVQPRAAVPAYDLLTWSYFGQLQVPTSPAFINTVLGTGRIVAHAKDPAPTPIPQSVQVLGGFGAVSGSDIHPYGNPVSVWMDMPVPPFAGLGARHILFTFPNDIYVLPSGVSLVQKQPPSIASVTPNGDGTVTIAGSSLGPDSRIYFDGLPATVTTPFFGSDAAGAVVVQPPPGASNQRATITVYNPDGQNSFNAQQVAPFFAYPAADTPSVTVTPSALPAGNAAMVDITASSGTFVDGLTSFGFASPDVFVQRVWVLAPNHLVANITIAATAQPFSVLPVNVMSGFQTASQPVGFQILPANPQAPAISVPIVNATPGVSSLYPGANASVFGTNLALGPTGARVTVNDQPAQILFASPNQINFAIPSGLPTGGPAVVKLNNGALDASPVLIQLDAPPPVVAGIFSSLNQNIDPAHPAGAGDLLNLFVLNMDPTVVGNMNRVRVNFSGVDTFPAALMPLQGQAGAFQVQVFLPRISGQSQAVVSISVDGVASAPVLLPIRFN